MKPTVRTPYSGWSRDACAISRPVAPAPSTRTRCWTHATATGFSHSAIAHRTSDEQDGGQRQREHDERGGDLAARQPAATSPRQPLPERAPCASLGRSSRDDIVNRERWVSRMVSITRTLVTRTTSSPVPGARTSSATSAVRIMSPSTRYGRTVRGNRPRWDDGAARPACATPSHSVSPTRLPTAVPPDSCLHGVRVACLARGGTRLEIVRSTCSPLRSEPGSSPLKPVSCFKGNVTTYCALLGHPQETNRRSVPREPHHSPDDGDSGQSRSPSSRPSAVSRRSPVGQRRTRTSANLRPRTTWSCAGDVTCVVLPLPRLAKYRVAAISSLRTMAATASSMAAGVFAW